MTIFTPNNECLKIQRISNLEKKIQLNTDNQLEPGSVKI